MRRDVAATSAALIGSCATATGSAFGAALFQWPKSAPSAIQRLINATCSAASGLRSSGGGIRSSSPSGRLITSSSRLFSGLRGKMRLSERLFARIAATSSSRRSPFGFFARVL
jgi:hypothetical protein